MMEVEEALVYYIFMSLMQTSILLYTIATDQTVKSAISDQMLRLSAVFDGRSNSSRSMRDLPRQVGWWNEMRYVRIHWGARDTFQRDFRMKRETFALLLDILRSHISGNDLMSNTRAPVDAETRFATALYWYATGQTYRLIGDLLGSPTQGFEFLQYCFSSYCHSRRASADPIPSIITANTRAGSVVSS
jgi:hypothetical protein